ncbi:ubiquitin-conjugating enzyme E2 C-like [Panonychus citri]|uniref:ubiquitin-conjugating enzyme E2 C-like n=1 Tax=Panonychus citri TaxID=50023 RepID=UPI002307F429|nr:ubiquitin-conjugating enzyme E2 C-like [Panonychus citri]XP_053202972.1 ubiquitin-conjugating enzyme E2 C-like [Panonychus citri]
MSSASGENRPTNSTRDVKSHASNRLRKELMDLVMSSDKGISAFPQEDNLFKWVATIEGPKDTVYENLKFKLNLRFTNEYPYVPPVIRFISHCYHPNIDSSGAICLDILKDKWTASYDIRSVLLSIQSLLNEPNLDDPLDIDAANNWKKPEFKKIMLSQHAKGEKKSLQ